MGFGRWFHRDREHAVLSDSIRSALATVTSDLQRHGIAHAVIGAVALAAHGFVRATTDADFLIAAEGAEHVHELMQSLGFTAVHRTDDVANYALQFFHVDFLTARRPYSRAMLKDATEANIAGVVTKIVRLEDLIGLKMQALANDPTRAQDRADIDTILASECALDLERVRSYYKVFDQEAELDAKLRTLRAGR